MISVAILGAGIGQEHLTAYRALPHQFDVKWIIDRDDSRARALDPDIAIAQDIDVAIADATVDLIDICLPPHLHVPVALKALAAGKHVICEKPIATSLADVDRLRAALGAANGQYFPMFQYRWGPGHAALRAMIDKGLAGKPQTGAIETHWSRAADYYAVPWRGTWDGEQGGAILGHAIHAHDLLRHFMGRITSLSAMLDTRINDIEVDDCAAIAFQLDGGALVTSSITLGAATDETRLRFVYENLTATSGTSPYAPGNGSWTFKARDPKHQAAIDEIVAHHKSAPVGFVGAFSAIGDAITGKPGREVTFDDGAASIELVTAIYHAARTGTQVALPLPADHPLRKGWQP